MISMSSLIAQTYTSSVIYEQVIQNGIILLIMIMSIMAIQNPYNSCMGSNEDQIRTLTLALSNTFLMLIILSIIGVLSTTEYIIYLVISIIGWIITFRKYYEYSLRQAAEVKYHGFWTKGDEGGYYDK
jgi:tetrahydromethanopterin S-methyltransferase subunit C